VSAVLRTWFAAALVLWGFSLGGCATITSFSASKLAPTTGPTTEQSDPWERFNRGVFGFNEVLDTAVVKPVAETYRAVVPRWLRKSIDNVFGNIGDVWSTANLMLQLKPKAALEMGMRVATNTVFGVFGILDVAEEVGLERRSEDFGQTLGVWGMSSGPYLVLPLLGPSTVRDASARVLDSKFGSTQLTFREPRDRNAALALESVQTRVNLLNASRVLDEVALDKYTFLRDAYLARRRNQVYDGEPPEDKAPEDKPAVAGSPPEAPASGTK
jgi:phospholipid-binding lipoprotein MlaA